MMLMRTWLLLTPYTKSNNKQQSLAYPQQGFILKALFFPFIGLLMRFLSLLFKFLFPVIETKQTPTDRILKTYPVHCDDVPDNARITLTDRPETINLDALVKKELASIKNHNHFIQKVSLLYPDKDKYIVFKFLRATQQFILLEIDIVTYENRLFKMGFINEKLHQNTHPRFLDNR